jgi:uncharacterized protein (DUF924 family)
VQGDALTRANLPLAADQLHAFWFANVLQEPARTTEIVTRWFNGGAEFDAEIGSRFGDLPTAALRGALDHWCDTPRGWLCLLLVLDQLPRNLYRDDAAAFSGDATALKWAEQGLASGWDRELHPLERLFVYLPLEHSEDLARQQRCVELTRALAESVQAEVRATFDSFVLFAERHHDVVARFGRFPHRNAALGRQSTEDELHFLAQSGRGF